MQIKEFLKKLSEASGVSGYEAGVRELVREEFSQYADQIRIDTMGNLIALKRGEATQAPRRSIMLAGHMDEIGLLVTKLEKGFVRFSTVGGFDLRVLPGQEVLVHGRRDLPGIIATRPPHVLSPEEREQTMPLDKLFIDVGLPEEELAQLVRVGDVITLQRQFTELAGNLVSGKAFDDRAAVACIAYCLQHLAAMKHSWDVYAVATVQEEVGLKGALTSTFGLMPDIGVAIDVCHGNMLGVPEVDTVNVGGGPAIAFGPNIHSLLYSRLVETAKAFEISYQPDPTPGPSGTDAWAMQVTREGLPTALVSIPLRYMHTTVETLSLKDVERTGRLLALFIASLDEAFAQALGLKSE
ncbi:MAG: M42 family metallopeptidase [Chloroflexi bacterium]|nr:M42 family metallopeptidase [Chloroflexota bacterium]